MINFKKRNFLAGVGISLAASTSLSSQCAFAMKEDKNLEDESGNVQEKLEVSKEYKVAKELLKEVSEKKF